MHDALKKFWQDANDNPGKSVDIGDIVACDFCDEDYTHSDAIGGFLFQSKGVCPKCAPRMRVSIKKFKEEKFIRGEAQEGETFKAFILRIRNGNNTIRVIES